MNRKLNRERVSTIPFRNDDWAYEGAEPLFEEPQVVSMTGLTQTEIRKRAAAGNFPKPVCGGFYWLQNDILKWIFDGLPVCLVTKAA